MKPLGDELMQGEYSLGIATDGDADRVALVDESGRYISSQLLILLLAEYIIDQKKISGPIIKTSSVTDKLVYYFGSNEREVIDVQVGFKYVSEKMQEYNASFGCEESGGYGLKGHIPERDGILFSFIILEMLAASGLKKISEYIGRKSERFETVFYDRIDLDYPYDNRLDLLQMISMGEGDRILDLNIEGINKFYSSRGEVNGLKLRLCGKSRWILIRISETEPIVRIYAEGDREIEVKQLLQQGLKLIGGNING